MIPPLQNRVQGAARSQQKISKIRAQRSSKQLLVEEVPGDGDLCSEVFRNTDGGAFELMHKAGEVVARGGDGGDAEGGGLPGDGLVHFGDGDVEDVGQLFLQAANDLAAVLKGAGMLDTKLEEHGGDGHREFILTPRRCVVRVEIWRGL
jgi:hypothetical protein